MMIYGKPQSIGGSGRPFWHVAVTVFLSVAVLFSCTSPPTHERFVRHRNDEVGIKLENLYPSTSVKHYIAGRILPNGNIEYGFKHSRTCRIYYQVDPETRVIVGWRWEGLREHCVVGA